MHHTPKSTVTHATLAALGVPTAMRKDVRAIAHRLGCSPANLRRVRNLLNKSYGLRGADAWRTYVASFAHLIVRAA